MNTLAQSDLFVSLSGLALITIAVFLIFVLGLLIKILSDVSGVVDRVKNEADEFVGDIATIRGEVKGLMRTVNVYISALLTANGVKQIISLVTNKSKTTSTKKKARRVVVSSEE